MVKKESFQQRSYENKIIRKRVAFDMRTDVHRDLKFLAVKENRNMFEIVEEAVEFHNELHSGGTHDLIVNLMEEERESSVEKMVRKAVEFYKENRKNHNNF